MELKAINILQKDYKSDEDFFLSAQAFIGPEQNHMSMRSIVFM